MENSIIIEVEAVMLVAAEGDAGVEGSGDVSSTTLREKLPDPTREYLLLDEVFGMRLEELDELHPQPIDVALCFALDVDKDGKFSREDLNAFAAEQHSRWTKLRRQHPADPQMRIAGDLVHELWKDIQTEEGTNAVTAWLLRCASKFRNGQVYISAWYRFFTQ